MRAHRTALLLLALGVASAGCQCGEPPTAPRSVVLIVVDTLRADHLGAYGYERETSPAIDALAARGVRFDRAYASAPWTMPSVASMLTGLYPGQHGLRSIPQKLDAELTTLPEALSAQGFATAAVVSHQLVRKKYQFDQGFDTFNERAARGKAHENISTPRVTAAAIDRLEALADDGRPFFLFAHYFDPHYNYKPHDACDLAPDGAGRLDGTEDISRLRKINPGPAELAYLRALYDEEICFTDRGIGDLLAALDDLDLSDETLVIFTADHGEELMERGWLGHTRTLHEEVVRVPLIVSGPGIAPGAVDTPVSLTSLPATVFSLLGLEPAMPGVALPLSGGDAPPPMVEVDFVPVTAAGAEKRAHKKALIVGEQKIIWDETADTRARYDLSADPGELAPLPEDPALTEALEQTVAATRVRPDAEAAELSEEEIEKLRALGYVQ